jgi:hypothetical protein
MRRFRAIAVAALFAVIAVPAHSDTPLPTFLQVLGSVTNAARPVGNALVIALNTQSFEAIQTYSGTDGAFSLPKLRAGVYKIIAVKQGFMPAIATIAPTRPNHRVALKLENEKQARGRDTNQELWELRGSLPPDVLRDLDAMMAPAEVETYELPRFRGEMVSMTGMTQPASPAYAQTAVGVQGRIGDTWQVGIRGNMQRFEDPTDEISFGKPIAESSVMSMEVRSSPTESVRVASTKSSWLYTEPDAAGGDRQADVRAHNVEWQHGESRVAVRYFQQDNLFQSSPAGSNLLEIAGNTPVLQTRRNDLGIALRVRQESVESTDNPLRTADLSANGTLSVVPALMLHYGVASRLRMDSQEWAPRTGAEWKVTNGFALIASGLYKVSDRHPSGAVAPPSIVFWAEDGSVLPRYSYSFGIVSGKSGKNRLTAIATVTAIDAPQRLVFTDGYDHFWDGLYVDSGDIRRDVRVMYRREIGNLFAFDITTTAGTATSQQAALAGRKKVYMTGDLQSTFHPTRTTLAVSYREIEQPREDGGADYRTERINLQMAQSLYLPVDIKVLIGLELARAENSPFLLDSLMLDETSKKYIGGLALNF